MRKDEMTDEDLARIVHSAHIAYNVILNDNAPDPPWDALTRRHREQVIRRVKSIREGHGPAQIHQEWVDEMLAWGWTWGLVKNPVEKTHPALRPYDELPAWQQAKDRLAVRIVFTFVLPYVMEEITHPDLRDNPLGEPDDGTACEDPFYPEDYFD